jgi:hypothetical protein
MPRKIAGNEMRTIDESSDAMNTPRVVFESATHLYRSSGGGPGAPGPGSTAVLVMFRPPAVARVPSDRAAFDMIDVNVNVR